VLLVEDHGVALAGAGVGLRMEEGKPTAAKK